MLAEYPGGDAMGEAESRLALGEVRRGPAGPPSSMSPKRQGLADDKGPNDKGAQVIKLR